MEPAMGALIQEQVPCLASEVWIWGTIPAGTGSILYDVSIDGGTPNVTSRASNGSAIYDDIYYQSSLLVNTDHTIVLRNLGSSGNKNSELQLDRFMFQTDETTPTFKPPGDSMSSAASITPSASSTSESMVEPGRSSSKSKALTIAGAIIGVLVVLVIVLAFFLWKSRGRRTQGNTQATGTRPHRPTLTPVPFIVIPHEAPLRESHSVEHDPIHTAKDPVIEANSCSSSRQVPVVGAHSSDQLPVTGMRTIPQADEGLISLPPPAYNSLQSNRLP
ncbi:hypothetical protein D9619_012164 [Psilocybe cf. subviscida]|uniref:Uncharacterized protein n=1 Tax=Psilocybe cf. subviscida TaxID=2480587 RepID=A0A8H5B9F2_9AGAR|nr:hypothetical protein D9619_012164 [Psilocybe cf. subviscida]